MSQKSHNIRLTFFKNNFKSSLFKSLTALSFHVKSEIVSKKKAFDSTFKKQLKTNQESTFTKPQRRSSVICHQGVFQNSTCFDLILWNQRHSLQLTGHLITGISDYHRLIYTVLKSTFVKVPPKEVKYRCYKRFSEINFLQDLSENLNSYQVGNMNYDIFELFFPLLNKHAPLEDSIHSGK